MATKKAADYRNAIHQSGLDIYSDIVVGDPRLWIPVSELEALLNEGLRGRSLAGLPLRTRSKVVKIAVCAWIGQVLSHAPADPSGLWIHKAVAAVLDDKQGQKLRDGFRIALMNSRGAHWVDPEAKPEIALAEQYERKAKAVEADGYSRLGGTLRDLAESYRREAAEIRRTNGYVDKAISGE